MRNTPEQVEHLRGLLRAEMESIRDEMEARGLDVEEELAAAEPYLPHASIAYNGHVHLGYRFWLDRQPVPEKRRPPVIELAAH